MSRLFPLGETIVASLDPGSRLWLPVQDTIVVSFTPRLWRGPQQFGELFTAVASASIPQKHPLTAATWPLLVDAPGESWPQVQVLYRASYRRISGYRRWLEKGDLEQEALRAMLEIIHGWKYGWTIGEAFGHLRDNYFAAMPRYVQQYFQRLVEAMQTQGRAPRDAEGNILALLSLEDPVYESEDGEKVTLGETIDASGQQAIKGSPPPFRLFEAEEQMDAELLIERVKGLEDPELRHYIELWLRDPELTHKEASARVGRSTVTMWQKIRRFQEANRRRGIS